VEHTPSYPLHRMTHSEVNSLTETASRFFAGVFGGVFIGLIIGRIE
jgi:hypothetical protein